ncbi:MAG: PQQ-dependent sugar dehydrogenase [Bacteroidales bacterium]|nr:PQQ-dependent sugar dehydrogenase [Bacteroidales bacterium]
MPDVMGYCDETSETAFCEEHNVKEPIAAWTPTLAVAGTEYYDHGAIPEWNNSLLMATLKESELVQLSLSEDGREITGQQVWFDECFGRLRDVCVSPDGRVYLAVSNRDGRGLSFGLGASSATIHPEGDSEIKRIIGKAGDVFQNANEGSMEKQSCTSIAEWRVNGQRYIFL